MNFEFKEFVPTERKIDLLEMTLQEAQYAGILNPMLLDIFFRVNLVLIYTDIELPENGDKIAFFDTLIKEDIMTKVEDTLNKEIEILYGYLIEWKNIQTKERDSFVGMVNRIKEIAEELLETSNEGLGKIEGLDLTKLQDLVPLAESLGINLNQNNV